VRATAKAKGDAAAELRATLELGQALLRTSIGVGFGVAGTEVDLDAGEETYRAAIALAEPLGDDQSLAAALRELGTIQLSRLRMWFGEQMESGAAMELSARVIAGESLESVLGPTRAGPLVYEVRQLLERALGLYERLGDRTGVMSTVIAMAYIEYAPMIHISGSARHIEEIRRVVSRQSDLVTESERARLELQLLYGVHVYARAKVVPDLMISRGVEAHRMAKTLGDRSVEFLAAGGVALSYLDMGDQAEAEQWLDRAATAAAAAPTPFRVRQLETWRGLVRAAAGDVAGTREHLERAVKMATDLGRPAARFESLAQLANTTARLGASTNDAELLDLAERSAHEATELNAVLTGHPPFGARAGAAIAIVALARGDVAGAVGAAGPVLQGMQESHHEDLDLDIVLPAGRAVLAGGPPEMQGMVRGYLRMLLSRIAQGTVDDEMRVRWLRGPVGRELAELAGPMELPAAAAADADAVAATNATPVDEVDKRLLHLLTQGSTNREMADELGLDEAAIAQRLAGVLASIGASSRAEATSLAFRGLAG
jgi:tetratricopeptide (TPR) repeat protein/DNA-binding CsgD family transcriptional regulator